MDVLTRGIEGYSVIVGGIALLAFVWGANQYLFKNTTAETGWPFLAGAVVMIVVLIAGTRRLVAASADSGVYHRPSEPYQWGSQTKRSDDEGHVEGNSVRKTDFSGDKFSQLRDSVGSTREWPDNV